MSELAIHNSQLKIHNSLSNVSERKKSTFFNKTPRKLVIHSRFTYSNNFLSYSLVFFDMELTYFFLATFGLTIFTWVLLEMIQKLDMPPKDDDEGGLAIENDFPIIDLPPGGTLDDLLVDRWHGDKVEIKKNKDYQHMR